MLDVSLLDLFNGDDKQPAQQPRRVRYEAKLRRFVAELDDRRLALVVALPVT